MSVLLRQSETQNKMADETEETPTAQQEFDKLKQEVNDTAGIEASAITLINNFPVLIQDAVRTAIADGATKAQIQEVVDEQVSILQSKREELAAALLANGELPIRR